jgi:DNA-binding response OmpR family regulator
MYGFNPEMEGFNGSSNDSRRVRQNTSQQFRQNHSFCRYDGSVQTFVALLLQKQGYKVITACNGKDALQTARDFGGKIHMLLSDVEMPGRTGIELAIQLNRERPETKVLLISGLDSGVLVLNNGRQFLPKPFMADMLRDRIQDFLSKQPSLEDHFPNSPSILRI